MSKRPKSKGQRSKTKDQRAKTKDRRPEARGQKPERRLTTRQILVIIGIVGVLAAGAALMVALPRGALEVSTDPFPAPTQTAPAPIASSEFVGSERCAECHRAQAEAWSTSTHARAGGPPGSVDVIAPFDGTPILFADAVVVPRSSGGHFSFTVKQTGAPDRVLSVDGVVGGGHMQGGGTQGFLSRFADGTWRFLPFDYSRQKQTWFCNTIGRGNRGWVAVSPALALTSCVDWPPTRVLGEEPRFSNCQSCHGSQIRVALDTTVQAYRTEIRSLSVSCESCHGPGARHLARLREPAAVNNGDLGMTSLATVSKDQSLGTCFQCHALKDQLRPGYASGQGLADYYSIRLPQLGDAAFFPDGRVRTFAYQEGHLYSDCYRNGGMTCASCHDPHSQRYRDVTGATLPGRFDDHQCTSCHASKADSVSRHTRHAAGSAGSRCTSCHMPYLQQPELGTAIPYARSDHSIAIPRPAADSALGIVGACQGCHREMPTSRLVASVLSFYGELKALPGAVQALMRSRDEGLPRGAAGRLLLKPDERHTQALFAGMAWFLERHLTLDMIDVEREVITRLEQLAVHADDDVAAMALASLHLARGSEPRTRRFLIARLDSLGERESRIRSRWGVIIGFLADRARGVGDAAQAAALYRRAREVDPRNFRIPLNLGLALNGGGDHAAAIDAYNESLAMDAAQPLTLVNLGIAMAARNDLTGAIAAYRRAIAMNPREPLAYFNLAAVYAGQAPDSAVANFLRAAELDPSLAVANFYAARQLLDLGNEREALRQLETGLRFDPLVTEARQMRDQLRSRLGRQP